MTDEQTAASKASWESHAPGWERNAGLIARINGPVGEWLIEQLEPRRGETFLELAAGPGDTGFEIARRVEPGGKVISTDIAPSMVEGARRRAADLGVTNVEFREMDAQRIDLADDSIDGVVHRFGPMLVPDPAASAREVRRTLRDGGRYAAASWGTYDRNPLFPLIGRTMSALGHFPPPPPDEDGTGPGGMSSMSDPANVRALLADAGFTDVAIEEVEPDYSFRSFDEFWLLPSEIATSGSVISALDDAGRQRVTDAMRDAIEPYREGEGYRFPAVAVCFSAR